MALGVCYVKNVVEDLTDFDKKFFYEETAQTFSFFFHMGGEKTAIPELLYN